MDRRSLLFTEPGSVQIEDTQYDPSPQEVIVETDISAISSGTELLIYKGKAQPSASADTALDALDGTLSYPLRYGYASVGTVVQTTGGVNDDWIGESVFAFNPHETRFGIDPTELISIPPDLSAPEMAFYPSIETAVTLILDGSPKIDEVVLVFGAGVIGLSTIALLSRFPLRKLVAVDPVSRRQDFAEKMGADCAIHPEAVSDYVDSVSTDGVDLTYELSGNPAALDAAIDVAGYDSRIVVGSWYGTERAQLELDTEFHRGRISIQSSQVSTIDPDLRGRWSKERRTQTTLQQIDTFDVTQLITHQIPFEDAPQAYDLLDSDENRPLQVLLTY